MNKKSLSFLLLAFVMTIAVFSCRKTDAITEEVNPDFDYYPLKIGNSITYNVDSTIFDDRLCIRLKKSYQMIYRVADTFTDGMGRPSYRIETLIRRFHDDAWKHHKVLLVTRTKDQVEFVESEQRYIKMTFPVQSGKKWNGNAYIKTGDSALTYFGGWQYEYTDLGGSFNTNEVIYNNTVTVNHIDVAENSPETLPESPASRTFSREIYAQGIGMVHREYIRWTYDPKTTRCHRGASVVMNAIEYNY